MPWSRLPLCLSLQLSMEADQNDSLFAVFRSGEPLAVISAVLDTGLREGVEGKD